MSEPKENLTSAICKIEDKCLQIISNLDNNALDGTLIAEIEFYANEARIAIDNIKKDSKDE